MPSSREVSPPRSPYGRRRGLISSERSSPSYSERRSSRHRHRSRRRRRHHRSRRRSRSRSRSRRPRKWNLGGLIGNSSENADDVPVLADMDSTATSLPVLERPTADWVCGVCNNLNSVQREGCFRCGASYGQSLRATPTEEIVARGMPLEWSLEDAEASLQAVMRQQAEPCAIVTMDRRADEAGLTQSLYFRFGSVAEATRALMYCRCVINLGNQQYGLDYSSEKRTERVLRRQVQRPQQLSDASASLSASGACHASPALPRELWPETWTPPPSFDTPDREKSYLALMSTHWGSLNGAQRSYYDERVKKTLASRSMPPSVTVSAPSSAPAPPAATTESSKSTSVEELKRRMAEKRMALLPNDTSPAAPPPPPPPPDPLAQLKERMAKKRAQLGSTSSTPTASSSEAVTLQGANRAALSVSKLGFLTSFPVPPSSSLVAEPQAVVAYFHIPVSVAQRVIPPTILCLQDPTVI